MPAAFASEILARRLRGQLQSDLEQLGSTPAGIAERLGRFGIKGVPNAQFFCPLAVWLQRCGWSRPSCALHDIVAYKDGVLVELSGSDLPPAARQFLFEFDRGFYPDLLKEGRT